MAEVIVALDLPSVQSALQLVDRLPGVRWVKVGPMLFIEGGVPLVKELQARGVKVFLDLKWHDIPHAVDGAVRAASKAGVALATVHALGGPEMLRAASVAARDGGMRLAAVSVLTSHSPASYATATGKPEQGDMSAEVTRLTVLAREAGMDAIVCSVHEAPAVRAILGSGGWIVTPGIRAPGAATGDQARVADPASAVKAGATHLVVGRPVTGAGDPAAAYQAILAAVS